MLRQFFRKPPIVLTLLASWCQQGSAETLASLSTLSLLPTSSFVTAIRQATVIQPAVALASSLPTLGSASLNPSSRLALFPSLPSVNDDKGKALKVAESPTTQEVAILSERGMRPRPPGIWGQCDTLYQFWIYVVKIEQIKEWRVPDDKIEINMRTALKRLCGGRVNGFKFDPAKDDGLGADFRFHLPVTFPKGCVEKAIVAAGGPPVSCRSGQAPRPWQSATAPYIPVRHDPEIEDGAGTGYVRA